MLARGGLGRVRLAAPAEPITTGDRGRSPRNGRGTLAAAIGWLPALPERFRALPAATYYRITLTRDTR